MRCENCRETIVGQPGRVGLTRAPGNGFYKGTRKTAVCADCVEKLDTMNASSAFRSTVEQGALMWRTGRAVGMSDEQIEAIYAGVHGPAVLAAIKAEVA